jgi:hypothetical protein
LTILLFPVKYSRIPPCKKPSPVPYLLRPSLCLSKNIPQKSFAGFHQYIQWARIELNY